MPRVAKFRSKIFDAEIGAGSAPSDAAIQTTRRRVNDVFLRGMLEAFTIYGKKALKESAQQQPSSFVKAFCLLMPKEMRIEHTSPTAVLSDEQLSAMIQELEARVAERIANGESAKVIEGTAVPLPSPPKPRAKSKLSAWSPERRARHAAATKAAIARRKAERMG